MQKQLDELTQERDQLKSENQTLEKDLDVKNREADRLQQEVNDKSSDTNVSLNNILQELNSL